MNFNFVRFIVIFRSDGIFASALAESSMKTPDGQ
jgi:hypothetical protein